MRSRNGVQGMTVLIAIVLALAIGILLLVVLTDAGGDINQSFNDTWNETKHNVEGQKPGLIKQFRDAIGGTQSSESSDTE